MPPETLAEPLSGAASRGESLEGGETLAALPLSGQVAIVTGAGRGIGRAIAIALGAAGAFVVCISRTSAELASVAAAINEAAAVAGPAPRALTIVFDLSVISDIPPMLRDVSRRLNGRPVDILVNNAGITRFEALECGVDTALWQGVLATNLSSPVALTLELLPSMLARGRGTIISIGSRSAAFDIPYSSAYSVSKTALLKFHQNLECEIGGRGVHCYYLQPGNVDTSIIDRAAAVDGESLRRVEGVRHMMSRLMDTGKIKPERVADACIVLATHRDAPLLSGLYVDLDEDVDKMLGDLYMGRDSRCKQRNLYRLKIETL